MRFRTPVGMDAVSPDVPSTVWAHSDLEVVSIERLWA
jgi:hypothetical protein